MATTPAGPDEIRLTAPDGTSLVGSAWAPTGTPRAALLVVHGLKDHAQRYGELAARLGALGVAAYGFDLRGHGRSGGARAWVGRFDEYVSDVDVVVGEVGRRSDGLPLYLLGHSLGGAIVTRYVLERSPRVAGVVLSAAGLRRPAQVSAVAVGFTKLLSTLAPHAAVVKLPNSDFSRDPAVVEAMAADPLISQVPAPARTAAELFRTMEWIRSKEIGFSAPVLALHGTMDRLTDPEGSRGFIDRIPARSKALKIYPGLYHDLLHEPERASVLADIEAWLAPRLG
jgi:acylglycerol lipase